MAAAINRTDWGISEQIAQGSVLEPPVGSMKPHSGCRQYTEDLGDHLSKPPCVAQSFSSYMPQRHEITRVKSLLAIAGVRWKSIVYHARYVTSHNHPGYNAPHVVTTTCYQIYGSIGADRRISYRRHEQACNSHRFQTCVGFK